MARPRLSIFGARSRGDSEAQRQQTTDAGAALAVDSENAELGSAPGAEPRVLELDDLDEQTAERVRAAAQRAAEVAEERATEEILALEEDLERAKAETARTREQLQARLAQAEKRFEGAAKRADEAAQRAAALQRHLDQEPIASDRLREPLDELQQAEARATEAKRAQAEAERRLRAEAQERLGAVGGRAEEVSAAPLPAPEPDREAGEPPPAGPISLNRASFDELRSLSMSVTQAKRLIKFRERKPFHSVDELDEVPGFPAAYLARLKRHLVP